MNSGISRKQELELEMKISELEDSLSELKLQLKQQEEQVQHEAIDNLESYLDEIDHKYENFRSFWSVITEDIQMLFKDRADDESMSGK